MQEKKNVFKEIAYWSKVIVLGVVLGTGLQFASAVWQGPTGTPTTTSIPGPITTGSGQTKDGGLVLNNLGTSTVGLTVANGDAIVANGNVGIGTANPQAKLDVVSSISLSSAATGYVPGMMYLGISDEGPAYDEEFVITMMKDDGTGGDDKSSIFIGPNSNTGGKGRVEIDAKTLFVDNANVGIGDATPDAGLKLDVDGKVGATQYCDQNGNNCVSPPFVGAQGPAEPRGPAGPSVSFYCIETTMGCPSDTVKMRNVDPVSGDAATMLSTCCGVK